VLNSNKNIPEAFFSQVQTRSDRILYSQMLAEATPGLGAKSINRTLSEVSKRVLSVAAALKSLGVKPGQAVAIISNTRPEWLESDLAILATGAHVVSVYPSLLTTEIAYILWDSGADIVFVENQEQFLKLASFRDQNFSMPACDDRAASQEKVEIKSIICFERFQHEKLLEFPNSLFFEDLLSVDATSFVLHNNKQEDIASIVYTSGTTAAPKGVVQTHANHLANVRQAGEGTLYRDDSAIYLMLPLAHSFAKLMGYIGFLAGVRLQFPSITDRNSSKINQRQAITDLNNSDCSVYPLVPRILEKLKDGIELRAAKSNLASRILKLSIKAGGKSKSSLSCYVMSLITAPILKLLKKKLFGVNFEYVISGGAKLPTDVGHFFELLGIEVLEGYGLTETCVATNCNRPGQNRIGSVGPVLANDIILKIAEDGEVLFSGPNISRAYHNKPIASARVWDSEGWFHTGDLGQIDSAGSLIITGRKKEIIVTAGGKKVVPDKIEATLKAHKLISQAVLIGEGRPYCVAILTLNQELVKNLGLESLDKTALNSLLSELEPALDRINSDLASFETIKKFLILADEFSLENGFLTPTLKVKRNRVMEKYAADIDQLYKNADRFSFVIGN
jgi:long-chain acyl-CoA synthetase